MWPPGLKRGAINKSCCSREQEGTKKRLFGPVLMQMSEIYEEVDPCSPGRQVLRQPQNKVEKMLLQSPADMLLLSLI